MLSRGISLIIPLVTYILLDVYTLAFTEKIQVTRWIFYGIYHSKAFWCITAIQHSRFYCYHNINDNVYFFSLALSSGGFRRDPNSLLFSLVNPSGPRPTKIPLIPGKEDTAIVCNISYGPIFGSGNDLLISNTPNQTNTCTVKLNNTYQLPPGQNGNTFLTGNMNFTLTETEVFKFEK